MSADHDHALPTAGVSRRQFIQGGAAVALGTVVLARPGAAGAASVSSTSLTGSDPLVAAMHVHAAYSEGRGSWEAQYRNCVRAGADVLYQTDHDFRARAVNYATLLTSTMGTIGAAFQGATTGAWVRHAASISAGGAIRVMVEASGSNPATQSLTMVEKPAAVNKFRTGIDGQTIKHVFGASTLAAGARYEMVLSLSLHPGRPDRPEGQYSLRYRFERNVTARRFTEGGGLVGVVLAPMPANGTTVTFTPLQDIQAVWPSMFAADNCSFLLSFVVRSPRRGVLADVNVSSVTVQRARHDAAGILAVQQAIAQRYSAQYGIVGYPEEEVSIGPEPPAHINPFGSTPEFSDKPGVSPSNWKPWYRDYISRAHAQGAAVSWNHPFGSQMLPLLTPAEQDALRRSIFAERFSDGFLGADILEVGYRIRGHVSFETHLALWDTLSRYARFITGNGSSDDHSGQDWRSITNGFLTGIWAASSGKADLADALKGGRAYAFHPGQVQGLQLDTLVDGAVRMGAASVSSKGSRTLVVSLANVPSGCVLEVVRSPVDYTGQDPRTTPLGSRSVAGTVNTTFPVDTTSSCFVRPQLYRNGVLVATGNPTWLLRTPPPGGIPAARQA